MCTHTYIYIYILALENIDLAWKLDVNLLENFGFWTWFVWPDPKINGTQRTRELGGLTRLLPAWPEYYMHVF